jgi:hypothetical protein
MREYTIYVFLSSVDLSIIYKSISILAETFTTRLSNEKKEPTLVSNSLGNMLIFLKCTDSIGLHQPGRKENNAVGEQQQQQQQQHKKAVERRNGRTFTLIA